MFPREGEGEEALRWLPENPDAVLAEEHGKIVGVRPLSLHHLAVWFLRDEDVESHETAIAKIQEVFHLEEYGLVPQTFSPTLDPNLGGLALGPAPMGDAISDLIGRPPGVVPMAAVYGEVPAEIADYDEAEEVEEAEEELAPVPVYEGTWDVTLESLKRHVGHLKGVEEAVIQSLAALRAGMHVVFTGPPGCGKTELAQRLCRAAGFPSRQVTATDHWGTFETIGGYFPDPAQGGQVLEFLAGEVVSAIRANQILIIDEVNRADIDKAFGELFTLLSGHVVDLPYRERQRDGIRRRVKLVPHGVTVPDDADTEVTTVHGSWRLIAAMNDADKASLKRLSYAFVRRFAFVPIGLPGAAAYEELIRGATTAEVFNLDDGALRKALVFLFASRAGLLSIGMPMGFAIPKAMAKQAITEGASEGRSVKAILRSALELYIAPQFQGRADKHVALLDLVGPLIGEGNGIDGDERMRFERTLTTWTGYRKK